MRTLHILFLLFITNVIIAQPKLTNDFTTIKGTPYPVIDARSKLYFSAGSGYTIAIKTDGAEVNIQLFDTKGMKETKRKLYTDFPKGFRLQTIVEIQDKLYYIYRIENKQRKAFDIYSREIDKNTGEFLAAKLIFGTSNEAVNAPYDGVTPSPDGGVMGTSLFGNGTTISVFKSFDNSRILFQYRNRPVTKDDSKNFDVIGFCVFDVDMNKISTNEVKMPYTEKEMNNVTYGVTKNNESYMLVYKNTTKTFELFRIDGSGKLTVNKLKLPEMYLQEVKVKEDESGNLICTGFYANGIEFKMTWGSSRLSVNVNGIAYFKILTDGTVVETKMIEFPVEFITQYMSDRQKGKTEAREEKGKAGLNDLGLLKIEVLEDGSTLYVGEQKWQEVVRTGNTTTTYYHFTHMVMVKLDKNGDVIWMKKLPKDQVGTMGMGGLSAKYVNGGDFHYLLFLDNVKNAGLAMDEVPAQHKDGRGGYLTAYKVNNTTGDVEKHYLFNSDDLDGLEIFQFSTTRIFEESKGVFMLEVYVKGKKDNMIKMELK